jgi:hypothetical protein
MTLITGTLKDSGNQPLSGQLIVTLDYPLVDDGTVPDSLLTLEPHTFAIANGVMQIELPESQTKQTTYHFQFQVTDTQERFFFASSGVAYTGPTIQYQGNWYTGGVYQEGTSQLLYQTVEANPRTVLDFHAEVLNVASQEFSDLQPTGITHDTLDTGALRVAQLISTVYLDVLKSLFTPRGIYDPGAYYFKLNIVAYNNRGYLCIVPGPIQGKEPTLTQYWQDFGNLTIFGDAVPPDVIAHLTDTSNPHAVTAAQVGSQEPVWNANQLQGVVINDAPPEDLQVLQFASTEVMWMPKTLSSGSFSYELLENLPSQSLPVTMDPVHTTRGSIYLYQNNLQAMHIGGSIAAKSRATAFLVGGSGNYYWEIKVLVNEFTAIDPVFNAGIEYGDLLATAAIDYGSGSLHLTVNDVLGVALKLDNLSQQLDFYVNGALAQTVTFDPIAVPCFPYISFPSSDTGSNVLFNFGGSAFAYPPPVGYSPIPVTVVEQFSWQAGANVLDIASYQNLLISAPPSTLGFGIFWLRIRNTSNANRNLLFDSSYGLPAETSTIIQPSSTAFVEIVPYPEFPLATVR